MTPTETLMHEHRVIEVVLDCLDGMADRCRRDGRLDGESAGQAIDFFRSFADGCHHAKEERQLFPLMETHGFSADAGPTAVMRDEHVQGRALIRAMEAAAPDAARGLDAARQDWLRAASEYSALLREHIMKEDEILFPMADQHVPAAELEDLSHRFDEIERLEIGPDVHDRYARLAATLARRFGVPTDSLPAAIVAAGAGHP